MSVVTALACLAALDDERQVCDALAEAVAQYFAALADSDGILGDWEPAEDAMRAALDAYHAHREVWS
jgi:hypothetical protein